MNFFFDSLHVYGKIIHCYFRLKSVRFNEQRSCIENQMEIEYCIEGYDESPWILIKNKSSKRDAIYTPGVCPENQSHARFTRGLRVLRRLLIYNFFLSLSSSSRATKALSRVLYIYTHHIFTRKKFTIDEQFSGKKLIHRPSLEKVLWIESCLK